MADAGYRDILLDEAAGNHFLAETLATSNDATLREIGEQLRDGTIDLRQLGASDCYRETLSGGFANLLQFDAEQLAEDLDTALSRQPETGDTDDRDREDRDREGPRPRPHPGQL